MKIAVIGSGYVGLVAGACFADTGNTVYCVDNDPAKIEALKKSIIPIYEPGLEEIVKRNLEEERLIATTDTAEAVKHCEIIFMAVGTPPLPSGDPDMSYLKQASEDVARAMTKHQTGHRLIVNKSTVPIGTHLVVRDWMRPHTDRPFDVVSNPEFLKEGTAVDDFLRPDRVIIGTDSKECFDKMAEIYAPFVRQGNPIIHMDPVSAEITKYACNSFLATRISFMNQMSVLCEKVGGNIEQIRKGMASDTRIGKHFLYAGAGYGGSCFPKDVQALLATARKLDVPMEVVDATEKANHRQKRHVAQKAIAHFKGDVKGKTFAIWGLAFKPNTDDIREAPAITIIEELLAKGAKVKGFDPVAQSNMKNHFAKREGVEFVETNYDALNGADALILVTEWNEFRHPDFERMKKLMRQHVIVDGRNVYIPDQVKKQGFAYYGIGR